MAIIILIQGSKTRRFIGVETGHNLRDAVDEFEAEYLDTALKDRKNNIVRTAKALGITRRNLYQKISKQQ